jgi:hypothetical protein
MRTIIGDPVTNDRSRRREPRDVGEIAHRRMAKKRQLSLPTQLHEIKSPIAMTGCFGLPLQADTRFALVAHEPCRRGVELRKQELVDNADPPRR